MDRELPVLVDIGDRVRVHMQPAAGQMRVWSWLPVDKAAVLHLSTPHGCRAGLVAVQADKFHKTGRQLRSKMWWQNMKMKVLVVSAELTTL